MCGICGFNWTDAPLVERMKGLLVHRGPDDHGSYVADGVSLGHRRLSIVDLSESGRQPLSNELSRVPAASLQITLAWFGRCRLGARLSSVPSRCR